jgi:hypothetical protein
MYYSDEWAQNVINISDGTSKAKIPYLYLNLQPFVVTVFTYEYDDFEK